MSGCARVLLAGVVAFVVGVAPAARADSGADAERMFELGRQAATQGQYATACNLFRESYRIDEAVGTLINLGDCEEHLGHPDLALGYFEKAFSRLSVTDDRLPHVQDRISALERLSAHLELHVGAGAPPGTKVTVDERVISPSELKLPLVLSPGNHVVIATAVGFRGSRQAISLAAGEARKLDVWPGPPLEEASPAIVDADAAHHGAGHPAGSSTLRGVGWGVTAVGVASLWVGSITGAFAIDRESLRSDNCNSQNVCNQVGYDAARSGKTFATVSTVTVAAGAVAVVAGLYLVLSNHPGGAPQTTVSPTAAVGGGGVTLRRSF